MTGITFKEAGTPEEIEEIHRLNHQIFAEEVSQHHTTANGLLIDRFHSSNHYFIATKNAHVIGMISVHDGPVFSVASRLSDVSVLSDFRAPLEVRLLAIYPEFRKRAILAGLLWQVLNYALTNKYSDLLISGIVQRGPMYSKMGFQPMGPAVPYGAAAFIPMRMSLEHTSAEQLRRQQLYASHWYRSQLLKRTRV